MVVNKKYIQRLREKTFIDISKANEKLILTRFRNESGIDINGFFHHYTEQDLWEQIRKIIQDQE